MSAAARRLAALPTAALAAVWAIPFATVVLGGVAIHSHRTRRTHR